MACCWAHVTACLCLFLLLQRAGAAQTWDSDLLFPPPRDPPLRDAAYAQDSPFAPQPKAGARQCGTSGELTPDQPRGTKGGVAWWRGNGVGSATPATQLVQLEELQLADSFIKELPADMLASNASRQVGVSYLLFLGSSRTDSLWQERPALL